MRKINFALFGLVMVCSMSANAITLEEMAEKNNKIMELDQEIAIAEKNKKLAEIKNSVAQPDLLVLPKVAAIKREESMQVLSVHGSPANPIVDVQYGDTLLQKQRGDAMPNGWRITTVGENSVTFTKRSAKKPDLIKTMGIGHQAIPIPTDMAALPALPMLPPYHAISGK
jgi:hypothetical protein